MCIRDSFEVKTFHSKPGLSEPLHLMVKTNTTISWYLAKIYRLWPRLRLGHSRLRPQPRLGLFLWSSRPRIFAENSVQRVHVPIISQLPKLCVKITIFMQYSLVCCPFRCHHEWRHEWQHRHVVIHDVIHDDNEMGNRPISYQDVALNEYCCGYACRRSFGCVLLLDQIFRKQCTVRQYTTLIYLINLLGKLVLGLWLDSELHYFSIFTENKKNEHLIFCECHGR